MPLGQFTFVNSLHNLSATAILPAILPYSDNFGLFYKLWPGSMSPTHNPHSSSSALCIFALVGPEQETVGTGIEALEGLQAQHSILIGDTGQGKSWILNLLLLLTRSDGEYGTAGWQLLRDKLEGGLEAVNDAQASAISTAVETS